MIEMFVIALLIMTVADNYRLPLQGLRDRAVVRDEV